MKLSRGSLVDNVGRISVTETTVAIQVVTLPRQKGVLFVFKYLLLFIYKLFNKCK